MYAVVHIALGYQAGKILSKATEQDQNIPALWTLSILPGIDLLIPTLEHRVPTHGIIIALLIFTPFFIMWSKKTISYFAALATHLMIGNYITDRGIKQAVLAGVL